MALKHIGYVDLPAHVTPGGFDHAAVHRASARLYVAHTCNDALDVIDSASDHYLRSIPNLTGVAGALVPDEVVTGIVADRLLKRDILRPAEA